MNEEIRQKIKDYIFKEHNHWVDKLDIEEIDEDAEYCTVTLKRPFLDSLNLEAFIDSL